MWYELDLSLNVFTTLHKYRSIIWCDTLLKGCRLNNNGFCMLLEFVAVFIFVARVDVSANLTACTGEEESTGIFHSVYLGWMSLLCLPLVRSQSVDCVYEWIVGDETYLYHTRQETKALDVYSRMCCIMRKNHHSKRTFFMFYRQKDRQSYNLQQYNITSEEKLHWQSHPCPFMEFFTHVCFLFPPWAAQSRFVSCSRLRKYLPTCIPDLLICFPKAVPAGQGGGRWVNTRLSNPSFWNAECTQLDERHRQNCSVETPSTPWHNAVKQIAFLQRFMASACPRCTRLHLSHTQPLFHPESWTPAATEAEILPRIPLKL